ncbi:MAG: antitoxin VapB family protein [Halobacteriales archaeon]|nr:antitoxin VapB family protein [Halobacteriales archaeon]
MASTSIRLSEEAKARLDRFKREGESYEDVIMRLTERDRWAGFGVLSEAETDTREGMERIREEMREGVTEDVED